MVAKKIIKGMLPDVKSTDMPEGMGYLIHNMRYKNGRLSPVDNMFKHLILKASDYVSAATQMLADSGDAVAIALINSTPLGGRLPIYAFLADGKLIVVNEAQNLFISNINGSLREGEYAPFDNTGGSAARFNRIPYVAVDNTGDPLPQNLLECRGFIPTKKLVGKTLYIGGVGHVCQGVYSVGVESNTKWLIKLEGFMPSAGSTYQVYEKKRVVNAFAASEYIYMSADYGAMESGGEYWMAAFNKSRKKNDIQQCVCFMKGKPVAGTVYCAPGAVPVAVLPTMGKFPRSQYRVCHNEFADENVALYCWSGRMKNISASDMYLAVRFQKAALPTKVADGSYKWRAKQPACCQRHHSGGYFSDDYTYTEYYLPFQGTEEKDEYILIRVYSSASGLYGINAYKFQTQMPPSRSVTVLSCGQGEWYTAADGMVKVDGIKVEHPSLLPEDTSVAETDDAYPQWGIIADGSPITTVGDGTTLYSGKLGEVGLFSSSNIAKSPSFLIDADHAVVVNPKTFSQAVVLTAMTGLVSFTPGTSSFNKVMNAPGAKLCTYFNNMLILANTVELEWVEMEGSEYDIPVSSYNTTDTGAVNVLGTTIHFANHEIIFSGQKADHSWVIAGQQVWFKGYGVPEDFDGVACMIKYVRDIDASHFGVVLRAIPSDTILETTGYTPNGVVMKMAVRSEKVYEQTVRSSALSSFMDFSKDEDSDTAQAYQLFGSFTPITGLAVLNNILYVFKRDTITEGSYTGNANAPISFEEDKFKFGGYNATAVGDKIFYYHPTKGICVFDGMREEIISDGINSIFSSGGWNFVPYMESAVAVIPTDPDAKYFYVYDGGAWSRVDGGRIIPVFNAPELEYIEITDAGVYYCSMPKTVRETGFDWRVNAYFPSGNTNAVFNPTPLAFSSGSYANGNIALEAPEVVVSFPLDSEKKDLAKRIKSITVDGMAGAAAWQRAVTCRVEPTHDRASDESAATDQAVTDAFFDGKSECKVYPNVVGRDPFCVLRAQRQVPTALSTDTSLYANWIDETSISAVNIDIESSGENPRR